MDVMKRKDFIVLVHNFRWDFARHNFAKQAVGVLSSVTSDIRLRINVGVLGRRRLGHAGISMATPLFMFTRPLTMRYRNQMDINAQAIAPGI